MKNKRNILLSVIMTIFSGIYIYLVKTVDVKTIGPNNTSVGFAKVNDAFMHLVGTNMTIYKLTEVAGLLVLLIVFGYIMLFFCF